MKQKSIKDYLWLSWFLPMACTILGSCALAFGLSYLDFVSYRRSEVNRLNELAPTVSRRVAAELLLKDQGRLEPVIQQLKEDYSLVNLEVISMKKKVDSKDIFTQLEISLKDENKFVAMERAMPAFSTFIQFRHFLLALLPALLMASFGFLLQRRFLRTFLIHPIESLAETSTGERTVDKDWPLEIQAIAQKLAESFSNREQAIFGQVAKGIIHDIRTNLHSMHTATQLVVTASDDKSRELRLEKLLSACVRNIPKIRSIVDLSLDSSREISMNPRRAEVGKTLEQALANLEEMSRARGVEITNEKCESIFVVHDPIQLERVLTNLLKNAIEATDDCAHEKKVKVSVKNHSFGLKIEVEDSGKGIADANAIFRPLKSSKTHGVGLGLFVSKKIVEAHGGSLAFTSSADLSGARFTVNLPLEVVL